jgi:drug/metabolite transporter (DMT)-like permease
LQKFYRMQKNKYLVYILTLLAVSFWGLSYIWMKVVFLYYEPITTMFLRLCLSSVFLFLLLKIIGKKEVIQKQDYLAFVVLSFFSPFCYFLGESFGLKHVTPTVAAVIIATIPVFTPLLGYIAFREKLTVLNIVGFFVSFIGVVVMVLDFEFRFSASPLGVFLLFSAVLSALINIIFLKKLAFKYSSLTIIKVQNLIGAIFFLPLFLIFDYSHFITVTPTPELIWALVKLSVFASTLAFMFYTIAVRNIGIARTSIFANLIPVCTAVFAWWILKETIDLSKILGITIVISGVLLTQVSKLRVRSRNV